MHVSNTFVIFLSVLTVVNSDDEIRTPTRNVDASITARTLDETAPEADADVVGDLSDQLTVPKPSEINDDIVTNDDSTDVLKNGANLLDANPGATDGTSGAPDASSGATNSETVDAFDGLGGAVDSSPDDATSGDEAPGRKAQILVFGGNGMLGADTVEKLLKLPNGADIYLGECEAQKYVVNEWEEIYVY